MFGKKNRLMVYNSELWDSYTLDNEIGIQSDLSKFIHFLCLGLGARKICEAGCNVGNNLTEFPKNFDVHGIDMNKLALEKAKKAYPSFKFQQANIDKIPYPDSFFDVVFTRGILIHIKPENVENAMRELLRVSNNWIFNLEYFGEDEKMIKWKRGDDLLWYRNMKDRWSKFDVEIISDLEIPEEIDSAKTRLTLVRKRKF